MPYITLLAVIRQWILPIAVMLLVHIYLSRRDSKWWSLVLPGVCFASSLYGLIQFIVMVVSKCADGTSLSRAISFSTGWLTDFFSCNAYTVVLLLISFLIRKHKAATDDMKKMQLQDLG